jgi:hypothetical protein
MLTKVRGAVLVALAAIAVALGVLVAPTIASADGGGPGGTPPSCGTNWDNAPCH